MNVIYKWCLAGGDQLVNIQDAIMPAGAAHFTDRTFPGSADVRTSALEATLTVA